MMASSIGLICSWWQPPCECDHAQRNAREDCDPGGGDQTADDLLARDDEAREKRAGQRREMDRAREILGIDKQRWRADVVDAALEHLLQSHENIDDARDEYDPETIQAIANTDVLALHYRTSIDSRWR